MTLKDKYIRQLQQLPEDLLKKLYHLDLVESKGLLQYDVSIACRYRKHRELSSDEDWIVFKIGDWRIIMESND